MVTGITGVFYLGVQSVSPVGSGDASNGLSIDGISGDVVLGNNVGAVGDPAMLLNSREILTDGNFLILDDGFNSRTLLDGASFTIDAVAPGASQTFSMRAGLNDQFTWTVQDGGGGVTMSYGFLGGPGQITIYDDGLLQLASPFATKNGAAVQVNGSVTSSLFFNGIASGAYDVNRLTDRGKLFTHQNAVGAITLNLPNMAFSDAAGFHMYVAIHDASGITIQAFAGQTINIGNVQSAVAGTVRSTAIGSSLHLAMIDPGNGAWQALSYTGAWLVN